MIDLEKERAELVEMGFRTMYKCLDCGFVFDMPVQWVEESAEELVGCPDCYGPCEEAYRCLDCGKYFLLDEMIGSKCETCYAAMEENELKEKYAS